MTKRNLNILFSFDSILWIALFFTLFVSHTNLIIFVSCVATIPVIMSAIKAVFKRKISVDLLASVALVVSIITKQWSSVVFINLMITSARIFGTYTEAKSHDALESLAKFRPQKARILKGNDVVEISVNEIKIGDSVLVELGEQIPVDGKITKGDAEVDQSSLTGESLLVEKKVGDNVLCSTFVRTGNIVIVAERVGVETTFEKFVNLVKESQTSKASIVTSGEKFSAWYIGGTIIVSALLYLFTKNISLVLGVLLVSCADDIAVAVPLAFLTSIGHAARHGAIIKGGNFIEILSKIKVILVDKTGTLTKGKLKVEKIVVFNGWNENDILSHLASVYSVSKHPSAKAVVEYAKNKSINFKESLKAEEFAGKGMIGFVDNEKIISGKQIFLEEFGIKINSEQLDFINKEKDKGYSITFFSIDGKFAGLIEFTDEIRDDIKLTISSLKKSGIEKIIMLTGDNEKIASRVANEIGIDEFHANLLPEDKLNFVKKYSSNNHKIMMIGDGVNDAAALALSDVGIAMGAIGSATAIESADIALMRDDISQVPELLNIGKNTMKIIKQDLVVWGLVNAIGLILVFTKIIGPEGAAAYNFLTDFLPLANSLRLFR